MIVTKPPRRRAPAFVLAQSSRSASPAPSMPSAPVRPSGAARPFTVRVVPPPPPGAALYARGANGRSEELTGRGVIAPEGDALLVDVPAWTLRLTALVAGQVVADVVLARPSGAVGDAVTLELTEATGLAAVLQGASNITRMPTPDGAPARWGDPAAGYPITSYFLGATEGGEALTVRATGRPARVFALGPVASGRTRIDLALRAVRWRRIPEGATIRLTDRDGTNITTNPLPNGAPAGWDGADWLSGVPVATRAVTIEKPDGTTQAVALPALPEGERELAVDVAPRELAILAPVVPLPPARERTFVTPGMVLYDVGGGGGGGGDAPPGMVNVRLRGASRGANGRPAMTVLVNGADGTGASLADGAPARWDGADWLFGLAASVRSIRARYADGAEHDLAVPVASAGATEVVVDLPAPPAALPVGVRVRGAVPGSRFFLGTTDVTLLLPTPDGAPARWDGADWLFGVPEGTRELRVRLPSGTERTLALPAARAGTSVTVEGPTEPAPAAPPAFLTLRVRGAVRGGDGLPTLMVFYDGRDITTGQLPDGRPARWDGADWLLGFPRAARALQLRYASGAVGTLDLPLPTDEGREVLFEAPQDVQQTNANGDGPLEVAPTSTLAFVRVWLIDPPRGTRLFRRAAIPDGVVHVAPPPAQEIAGYGTDLAGSVVLPASGRASVPVYEYRLPDTADGTVRTGEVWAALPDGSTRAVALAPVPPDGILRVDLSGVPGDRSATVHAASSGGGFGVGAVVAVGAVAAAGWALFGRRAPRNNPSGKHRHRQPRRASAGR
jgi:hypothetical protein